MVCSKTPPIGPCASEAHTGNTEHGKRQPALHPVHSYLYSFSHLVDNASPFLRRKLINSGASIPSTDKTRGVKRYVFPDTRLNILSFSQPLLSAKHSWGFSSDRRWRRCQRHEYQKTLLPV